MVEREEEDVLDITVLEDRSDVVVEVTSGAEVVLVLVEQSFGCPILEIEHMTQSMYDLVLVNPFGCPDSQP